ncbi:MAG: peptide MFS transporter [Longimicrobiales bacterium]|nr:peptide MFS transporter [Longimicrobiales bacterium]
MTTATAPAPGRTFFGHPRGLATLFFTEMWERFSYYGMRALLILYLTEQTVVANPGLGFDPVTAGAIYGLYTGLVYLLALPGGWVADTLWGKRKSVYVGGWIIAAGHFSMAVPFEPLFFIGLFLITIGTGLLKPNVSTVVGDLYPEGGARRDAGFSIFYMGINLGAILGPLACSAIGEGYNYHLGFSLAGIGMVLGLIQYRAGLKYMGDAGHLVTDRSPEELAALSRKFFTGAILAIGAIVAFGFAIGTGTLDVALPAIADALGAGVLILVAIYFGAVIFFGGHSAVEVKRLWVIVWLFLLSAVFWSGFEQAGSSLNLYARDLTDRTIGTFEVPAGWFQSVNSTFIVILAPVFGALWVWLGRRNANPSIPAKFGWGLLGLSMGFLVVAWGAANATPENGSGMSWLIVMYFLHTCGELALSPVGLSAMTKLSPVKRVGQVMGLWFVSISLGNLIAGRVAGMIGGMEPTALFRTVALIVGGVGVIALAVSPLVKRLQGGVE